MAGYPIGVMVNNLERDRLRAFDVAVRFGFDIVHTSALPESWLYGPEREHYIGAARRSGVDIASMFLGFGGQSYADMASIARTVGLVIPELREHRTLVALAYSGLARELGCPSLSGHIGFIPAADHPEYIPLVDTVRQIADHYAGNGQTLHLETGQDSADVLLRFIRDVDRPNLGVNFDPGNFILYGSDEPARALDVLGPLVRGVHCKDGLPSGNRDMLGAEVPLGQGRADFPNLLRKLAALRYSGPLVIEHESGGNIVQEILEAREFLVEVVQLTGGR